MCDSCVRIVIYSRVTFVIRWNLLYVTLNVGANSMSSAVMSAGSFLVISRSTAAALARTAMGVSLLLVWITRQRSNSPRWLYRPRGKMAVPHVAQLTPAHAYCAECTCGIMHLWLHRSACVGNQDGAISRLFLGDCTSTLHLKQLSTYKLS